MILVSHAQAALTGHPRAGGKMIEVAKVRITAAGRDALAAEGWWIPPDMISAPRTYSMPIEIVVAWCLIA